MASSVTTGLRSPVTVLLSILSFAFPVLALLLSRSYGLSYETSFSAFVPALSILAPLSGAFLFFSGHRVGRAMAADLATVALAPSVALFTPLAVADPASGIAFASLPVFFSRVFLAASLSSLLTRLISRPLLSSLTGCLVSAAYWMALASLADRACHPVGGLVAASRGLLPVSETIAGIAFALACASSKKLSGGKGNPSRFRPTRAHLILIALGASFAFYHADVSLTRLSSVSKKGAALVGRLDSSLSLTLYGDKADSLSVADRSSVRHLLESYESVGDGFFRFEEVEGRGTSVTREGAVVEYRGTFRWLPPIDSSASFERDLCVAVAALLGDDVVPEAILVSGSAGAGIEYAGEELARRGIRVSYDAIPDRRTRGKVVIASGIKACDVPRLRSYLDSGGAALFLISGVTCDVEASWDVTKKEGDALIALLSEYGATPAGDLLASTRGSPLRMPALDGSGIISLRYPYWIKPVRPEGTGNLARSNVYRVLSGVQGPTLLWPSSIDLRETDGVTNRIILTADRYARRVQTPVSARPLAVRDGARVTGDFHGELPVLVSLSINENPDSVIILSDERSLGPAGAFSDTRDTLRLVANCVEFLSGKDEYADLRRGGL